MDEHLKWETLSSEYVAKESWFTVRRDTCKRSDGKIIKNYFVFEFPEWATAFDAWVSSHPARPFLADDSRDAIYGDECD